MLSIVNLGFGGKSKPKVGYATALDMYIILCLFAVFAALVEFACINFIDTFIKRFKKWEEEQKEKLKEDKKIVVEERNQNGTKPTNDEIEITNNGHMTDAQEEAEKELVIVIENGKNTKIFQEEFGSGNPFQVSLAKSECVSTVSMQDACVSTEDDDFEDLEDSEEEEVEVKSSFSYDDLVDYVDKIVDVAFRRFFRKYSPLIPQWTIYQDTLSVIYAIDDFARKGFPLVFLGLQILYWTLYLYLL